eukprot:comp24098_c0_seq1/m.43470 comp24098_c0_seq1/g.43470  ORF comp24098_c0_seq1/g.43470 comp24098_c0_seq1/m.43470 type:complete len:271 (-) comp24098_c0_seq1:475-1287(-)
MSTQKGDQAYTTYPGYAPTAPPADQPPPYSVASAPGPSQPLYPQPNYQTYQPQPETQAYIAQAHQPAPTSIPPSAPASAPKSKPARAPAPVSAPQPPRTDYHQTVNMPANSTTPLVRTTTRVTYVSDNANQCGVCVGNMLWFFLGGGFIFFIVYVTIGLALCLTLVGIPFGVQLFKLAQLSAAAFGKEIGRPVHKQDCCHCVGNLLWLPIGISLAITHLVLGAVMCATIIGIPFAYQHAKLAELALWPFGSDIEAYESGYQVITTTTQIA